MSRLRRLVLITVAGLLAVVAGGAVIAQTGTPGNTPPQREIYTALGIADAAFEPEMWLARATEQEDRTTAEWRSDAVSGLAYLEYLHFDPGIAPEDVDAFFSHDWFDVVFSSYASWEKRASCNFENLITLREFAVVSGNTAYTLRYWTQYVNETRVLALFLTFPQTETALLDTYAERLFPESFRCEGDS